jgi:hypothetical protein
MFIISPEASVLVHTGESIKHELFFFLFQRQENNMNLVFSIFKVTKKKGSTETRAFEQSRCSESVSIWQDAFYLPFHMARDQAKEASHKNYFSQGQHHWIRLMILHIIFVLHANLFSKLHGTLFQLLPQNKK